MKNNVVAAAISILVATAAFALSTVFADALIMDPKNPESGMRAVVVGVVVFSLVLYLVDKVIRKNRKKAEKTEEDIS
jgi:preprotein translocase subunit SecE